MTHIKVSLTPRLIKELPRFFGGRLAAVRELYQNAYRANAKNVTITLEGNTLTFTDDGDGCPEPQMLLSAGATGWDETKIIEPAGLGFFSLLSSDVAASVEAQSYGWKVRLVGKHVLEQQPVTVETGTVTQGMQVKLVLVGEGAEADIKMARGHYPYRVTLNGEEVPIEPWGEEHAFQTPVGQVDLKSSPYPRTRMTEAIWEYRSVEGQAFQEALHAASTNPVQEGILRDFRIRWFVDPACEVTPKLPDRNDMQRNAALVAACKVILSTIEHHFRQEAAKATAPWPRTLPTDMGHSPAWLFSSGMGDALLRDLGWHKAQHEAWDEATIYYLDGDGWKRETSTESRYSKDFIRVRDADVADSINHAVKLGAKLPFAVVASDGLVVRIKGKKAPKSKSGWIQLAREIRVGNYSLPFLLGSSGEAPLVTLPCDADTAVAAVTGEPVALASLPQTDLSSLFFGYVACNDYDTLSNQWGDYEDDGYHALLVEASLVEQISEDFVGGSRSKARTRLYHLKQKARELGELATTVERLTQDPTLKEIQEVKQLSVAFASARQALAKQVERAARQARMPRGE